MMHLGWTTEADGPPLWQSTDVWCHDVVCTGFDPDDLPPAERHWFDLYALNRVVDNGTVFLCETSTWVPPRETKTFCPKSPIVDLDPPTRANKGTSEDSYRHFAPFVDNKAGFWIPANARDRAECEQHLRMICEEVPVDMNPAAWRAAVLAHFELAPPTPKMFWILLRTPSSARRVAGNIAECIRMDYSDAGHWSATVAAYKRACAPRAQVRPERPTWKARLHF
jgi:hypothetical protein